MFRVTVAVGSFNVLMDSASMKTMLVMEKLTTAVMMAVMKLSMAVGRTVKK